MTMKLKFLILALAVCSLVSCSSNSSATALPTVDINAPAKPTTQAGLAVGRGNPAASGIIVAEQEARMAFSAAGSLKIVNFVEGDQVTAGQVLAELDNDSNQRDLEQVQRNLTELTSPGSQAAAAKALANAQQELKDQQDKVDGLLYRRASDTLIQKTQSEINLAKQALSRASDAYRKVARLQNDDNRKAEAVLAMTNAQLRLNDLVSKYNWYTGKPSEIDTALAKAKYDIAKTSVQEAEWYLAALKGASIPANASGANLARLEAAQADVADAQQRLDKTRLVSPIAGVVIKVNKIVGEMVSPGEVLFVISDVKNLHVETTDLSERDVASVKVGQKVTVTVKALNIDITGQVTSISPVADTIGGDVVYKTKIYFEAAPEGLRAGMSVDVRYQTEP
jgi:multidrug efflux pump subunit AcrA (membrane-fusion protein)